MNHPTRALSEVVHQRHRLGVLTIAREVDEVDFAHLRETLDLTAGNLSRHLSVLEEAGLIEIRKGYAGRRPRTWVRITADGRTALDAELQVLRQLVEGVPPAVEMSLTSPQGTPVKRARPAT